MAENFEEEYDEYAKPMKLDEAMPLIQEKLQDHD